MFNVTHQVIAEGDQGIRQTCHRIRQLINQGKMDVRIRELAAQITRGARTVTDRSQALVSWFMKNIGYRPDDHISYTERGLQPIDIHQCPRVFKRCEPVEILNTVHQVLHQRTGDCDDHVTLDGALHESIGIPVRLVTIAADPTMPREFSHIYMIANLDGSWVPIDTVNRAQPFGWEHPSPYRKEVMC